MQALSRDDFATLHEAAGRVHGDADLQALAGLNRLQAQELVWAARTAQRDEQYSFWNDVHHDRHLIPHLMDVFIASGQDVPKTRDVLSLLVGQRASQLQAREGGTPLARQARRFAPKMGEPFVVEYSLQNLVTFQHGGDQWTYIRGIVPRFTAPVEDLRLRQSIYSLGVSVDPHMHRTWVDVSPEDDHSAACEKRIGELDIRMDGVPISFDRVGWTKSKTVRLSHSFAMTPSLPSRLLTARVFGYFHSALFIHSARILGR